MSAPCNQAGSLEVLEFRMDSVERSMEKISAAVQVIAESTAKMVATSEGLERAFVEIEKLQGTVLSLQLQLPLIAETSAWVKRGVVGVVAIVGAAAFKLVFL